MKEQNNIEKLFQESFKDFEVDPGPNVWTNVQSGVHGSSATGAIASKAGFSWVTSAIVGVTITAIAVGGYFFFDNKAKQEQEVIPTQAEVISNQDKSSSITTKKKNLKEIDPLSEETDIKLSNSNAKNVVTTQVDNKTTSAEISTDIVEQGQVEDIQEDIPQTNDRSPIDAVENTQPITQETGNEANSISETTHTAGNSVTIEQAAAKENADNASAPSKQVEESTSVEEKTVAPNIYLPNFFSPNFDGTSDVFIIKSQEVDLMEIQIFSMSSSLVFKKTGEKLIEWDGTLPNGSIAPEGQYFYQLIIHKDGKQFVEKKSLTIRK